MTTITLQEIQPTSEQSEQSEQEAMPDFTDIPTGVITGQTTEHTVPSVNEAVASTTQLAEVTGQIAVSGAGVETIIDPALERRQRQIAIIERANPAVAAYFTRDKSVGTPQSSVYVPRSLF